MPIYEGNYLVSSQGFALIKISLNAKKSGAPIYVKSFMTAASMDIDCFKGKVLFYSLILIHISLEIKTWFFSYTGQIQLEAP